MATIVNGVAGSGYGNDYIDSLIWGGSQWSTGTPITYWFGTTADVNAAVANHGAIAELKANQAVDGWSADEIAAFQTGHLQELPFEVFSAREQDVAGCRRRSLG